MVSRIVCLMMIIGLTCGATWMGRLPMKPRQHAHKTGCYIPEIDDVIPFGEEVSPAGSCYRIECLKQRLSYASCEVISIEDESSKCYVTNGDLSRPYPDCCQQIKCEEDNYLI
ncbi:uncharacterized protein LOC126769644 [Nymphalis io]|uniref:uncharacterized protein LOC126769644 n=1 Tax=Inachis io TaxID=171585 RepID=UPI0021686543|nr:uncharacterized protein LOC126769644 [Nymphalis io]XP_050344489.1 uncharacterized protein LOC126769644 [Nymphalis io]XP_050344490.1 uncharacterized protein LOC126769644 [Nymphalis io]